jgi:hypothetical protein
LYIWNQSSQACIAVSIWFQERGPEKLSGKGNMVGSNKKAALMKLEEEMEPDLQP